MASKIVKDKGVKKLPKTKKDQASANRRKGRYGEFLVRAAISYCMRIQPSCLNLRSKSAPGCDIWPAISVRNQFPFCVEVKNRKRLNFLQSYMQTLSNVEGDMLPLLISIHDIGPAATLPLTHFFVMMRLLNRVCPDWKDRFQSELEQVEYSMPKGSAIKYNIPDFPEGDDTCGPE